jgi:hypothetical protein
LLYKVEYFINIQYFAMMHPEMSSDL